MNNSVGLYHLFGENNKVKKLFYEWCKENDEFCEWDVEQIAHDLGFGFINNTAKYIHFSNGNILDFLEENGYYIGLPLRGKYKFATCCYYKDEKSVRVGMPFYNNAGIVGRKKSLEKGIEKCIEHFEKRL